MEQLKQESKKLVFYDGFLFEPDSEIYWTNEQGEKYWVKAKDAAKMWESIKYKDKKRGSK